MKKHMWPKLIIALLVFAGCMVYLIGWLNFQPLKKNNTLGSSISKEIKIKKSGSASIDTSVNWQAAMLKDIERHMYAFSTREDGKMRGFNKANAFAAEVNEGTMLIKPRKPDGSPMEKENMRLTLRQARLIGESGQTQELGKDEMPQEYTNLNIYRRHHQSGLIEEFVNTPKGLRQNFEIFAQPKFETHRMELVISAGNKVKAIQQNGYIELKAENLKKYTYSGLKSWDKSGRELVSSMYIKNGNIYLDINTNRAEFPIYIDPLLTSPSDTLEANQASAYFGHSVASAGDVNGDGYSDVIVGAIQYSNGQSAEGAAFVYHGSASGLNSTANWTGEGNQTEADYGYSVASAGDVNGDGYSDVIVGARLFDNGHSEEGAVYVYHGSRTGLNTSPNWNGEGNQTTADYGYSVSCAGDVNGDGYSDVIIGAIGYGNGQANEGAAFVYHGSSSGLNTSPAWTSESNQVGAFFGNSVASAGDVNGDGYSDIVIGAFLFDNGQTDEGTAFVYHGSSSGLNTSAAWTGESNQNVAYYGNSAASAGDVNGDGYSDIIVGASGYDNGQTNEGAAFVYHGSSTGLNTSASWTSEVNQAWARYGRAVASAGDVNGDGYSDIIIGDSEYDNGQTDEGAAFVYHGSSSGLNNSANWTGESNQGSAWYGRSVASAGDVNGDGFSDMILGAAYYDNGQTDEGTAFVFMGSSSGLHDSVNWTAEGNQSGAYLGNSVASAGDVNGDGFSDVIIGASYFDNGQSNEGAVFVYYGSATGLSLSANWTSESNQVNAIFGNSVSSAGDVNGDGYADVIIGAEWYDNGQSDEGAAFVYHGSSGGLNASANWSAEGNQNDGYFGNSVSSCGDVNADGYSDVMVAAPDYSNGQTDEGAVFVYHGSSNGLSSSANWTEEGNQTNLHFGHSVSSAGDANGDGFADVIIGAPYFADNYSYEGAAFVFYGSNVGLSSTPNWQKSGGQTGAYFGWSVASAGDVNGDGFSDITIGAINFTNGQNWEGAAFVYHGSNNGLNSSANWSAQSNQVNAYFGWSVASAGDVNGDGYSDVIIGVRNFDDGQTNEGAAFVFHGSNNGLNSSANWSAQSNQVNAYFGWSVASAGDVNGDGYSDVIISAKWYTNGQTIEGAAFVYYGNNADTSRRNNLRLLNTRMNGPIGASNYSQNRFGMGLFAQSFLGRTQARLTWEVKRQGDSFSRASTITNSTLFSSRSPSFTSTGTAGIELKDTAYKVTNAVSNKVRARLEYHKATAITGQVYGPWRYVAGYSAGGHAMNPTPLPIDLLHFQASPGEEHTAVLHWIIASANSHPWIIQRSLDGVHFLNIGQTEESNLTQFSFTDKTLPASALSAYYRLGERQENGLMEYSDIKSVSFHDSYSHRVSIYPNPAHENVYILPQGNEEIESIHIYDATGKLIQSHIGNISPLPDWSMLPRGVYMLHIKFTDNHQENHRVLHP